MRIVILSDLHGKLPEIEEIPECDILVLAGDNCPIYDHTHTFQVQWLQSTFAQWLIAVAAKARYIVGIAGNHDFVADPKFYVHGIDPTTGEPISPMELLPWTYLRDQAVEIEGLKIYGTPWSNTFGPWAFMDDEFGLQEKWAAIPDDTELLVVHGPPHGYGDDAADWNELPNHVGSRKLAERMEDLRQLRVVAFGHIHEGYGQYRFKNVKLVNGAYVNSRYKPVNKPIVVDLD